MLITLTEDQMLERWRLLSLLEPLGSSSLTVTHTDFLDINTICRTRMRAWYLSLLDAADPSLVEIADLTTAITSVRDPSGRLVIRLDPNVRRVTALRFPGWSKSITPLRPGESQQLDERLAHAANPFLRGGNLNPLAFIDGDLIRVLSPITPGAEMPDLILGTIQPSDGSFRLDEKALSLITPDLTPLSI